MLVKQWARTLGVVTLLSGCIFSQEITGTLTGTIVDFSGAPVPGAQVEAKNLTTGAVRNTVSGPEGVFALNSLAPARYNLTAKAARFKTYQTDNLDVTASETRDLGKMALALGGLTEEISVTAAATPVQTASSENGKIVDSDQIVDLTLKGRDLFAALVTIPGVYMAYTYLTGGDATSASNGITYLSIDGGGAGRVNFTVDGITDMDSGSNQAVHYEPTMDTIAEVRVLTANYQAEYGRNSGGAVSVITKGGSQEFHGAAYANKRHEMFNAKTFFNNLNNVNKSVYRFFVWGYTIGGPVYIPKHWNTQKKRSFFFFSQEYTKQKPATDTGVAMVPTAAQMAGNFFDRCITGSSPCVAGYTNGNGTNEDPTLRDPTTGTALAGGNLNSLKGTAYMDPASAAYGQAILGFLPRPNLCDAASGIYNGAAISPSNCPAGYSAVQVPGSNYSDNYFWQFNETHPRRNNTVRFDTNLTSKLTAWARYIADYDQDTNTSNGIGQKNAAGQWVPAAFIHPNPGHGYGVGITYAISPAMVNEFTFGKSYNTWDYYPLDPTTLARSQMGNPPSFDNFATDPNFVNDVSAVRPTLGPGSQNFQVGVPAIAFGGGQEPNESGSDIQGCSGTCPYTNWNNLYSFNDALSRVQGKHNLKAGIYIEHNEKVQHAGQTNYTGAYSFASGGVAMPADTQDGFANAWLGNFNNYNEGQRDIGDWWYWQVEAFVQDNWRVNRRLTLDLGIRFYHMPPPVDVNTGVNAMAVFVPSAYNAATAERIYYPGCFVNGTPGSAAVSTANGACPAADQFAVDPATGYRTFYSLQGTLVPASVGGYNATPNPFPGMVVAGTNGLPPGLYTKPFLSAVPRFGFAWDVFGNGKTAVRGGVGIFLNRPLEGLALQTAGQSPVTYSQTVYYSNINSIDTNRAALQANAAIGVLTPIYSFSGAQPNESDYNGSFMIQQKVGFSTVVEASWVFNLRRHMPAATPINYSPLDAQYNPNWVSPMAQYLLNPAKNGGLTQGNASGVDLSSNYFFGPSLCGGCVAGLGALSSYHFDMSSATHALQITVRRNMTRHLSYGLAYNFQKTLNPFGSGLAYTGTHDALFPDKSRNFGAWFMPAPQTASINYVYEAPNLGQKLNFKPLGWITDHWTWSGITQFWSDQMTSVPGISFTGTNAASDPQENWTGSSNGARMFVVGNYRLSSIGQSPQYNGLGTSAVATTSAPLPAGLQEGAAGYTTSQYGTNGSAGAQLINEAAFQIPFPCSATPAANPVYGVGESLECYGNAGGGDPVNVPGTRVLNFDMTFSKNFPLKSEKRALIFRAEMYNIFNHPQFDGWNITPSYDWNNWKNGVLVQTSNTLGRYLATTNPRQMSMSLRLQF